MVKQILIILLILTIELFSKGADAYAKSLILYQNQKYKEAYPLIAKEAKKGNKEAQYLLGEIFEKGHGQDQNSTKSIYWYKKSSSKYAYITKEKIEDQNWTRENFVTRFKNQMRPTSEQKGAQYAFSKLDVSTPEVKSMIMKFLENSFGLLPYHTNYFAPFSYSSTKYHRHFTAYSHENIPDTWQPYMEYDTHFEAEYQLSFQKPLTYNLLGWHEYVALSYTQQVWWKLYDESGPFRETNYTPELFVIIPTSDAIDEKYNLKSINFGYRHQSNGQEGHHSRSWDRLFCSTQWQWNNLFLKAQGWYRLPEDKKDETFYAGVNTNAKGDDNPDIYDYMGYGDIEIKYLFDKNQLGLLWRNNLHRHNNRGALQLNYSTPFINSDNTYWYMKLFSGYGESMIDYDRSVSKLSIGFAFSRGIF